MAEVPEAFVEVTVSSTGEVHSLGGHCPQKTLHKSAMQEDYRIKASLGGFPVQTSELLTRLDRGEVAWVPELHSSDESTDEGPVKPTLKRWPKGGAWWDRYRSPTKYPSSDSSSSDDDQRSDVEDEKPQRGGHRLTILRRSILDSSRGNGSLSVKANDSLNKALQPKRSPGSQAGKTQSNLTEAGHENNAKEKLAEEEQLVSCPTCGRFFKSKISLSNHQRIHSKDKPSGSSSSGKRVATEKMLISHQACHAEEKDDRHPSRVTRELEARPEVMLYKCPECKKCFMLKDHLLLHQRKHARGWSHKCSKCGKGFVQMEQLVRHQKIHLGPKSKTLPKKKARGVDPHENPGKRRSPALSRETTSLSELGSTDCQEVQSSRHKCQFCGKCLRSKSLLVDHERIHKEPRDYKCLQCQKSFRFKYHLKTHQRIHMKAASCRYCGKHLSTHVTLANHEMLHTGERPYKCHTCPQSFIRKHRLLQHQKIHENERHCEYMKALRRQKRMKHLAELEGIHAGSNQYKGRIHHQSFPHKSSQKSHTEGKYNKCQYCGVYMKKAFLKNHMKIHRKKKIYQCLKCWKSFYQKNHLVVHQRNHVREKHSTCLDSEGESPSKKTSLEPENPLTKNLSCCYCGRNFDSNYSLTRHEKIHLGGKPFRCAVCDKGFIEKWSVKRHEKIHLKGSALKQSTVAEVKHHRMLPRAFTCAVCGKGFKQTWNLKRHVKTHLKNRGLKQPIGSEGSRVFSDSTKRVYSQGKGRGGSPASKTTQSASKIAEDNFLEDTGTSGTRTQVVLGKGSKMRTSRGCERKKMQTKVHVKLPRKSERHSEQNYREVPASQTVQTGKRVTEEGNIIFQYKQDKHGIPQQNEPQTNLQGCEMVHVGLQSTSQAMPRRKSKRKVCLAGHWVRSCFCQKEGSKMAPRKRSSNSTACKKSPNSKDCRRVKACFQDPTVANDSSGLFKNIPKNCKLGSPRLSLPLHRTLRGESKMELIGSATPGQLACSEQDRETQEALGKQPEDIVNSQGTKQCQAYTSRDQAEPDLFPVVPRHDVEQNISRIQVADGLSNAALQQAGTASVRQQMDTQPMSPGEPFSPSCDDGGECTEAQRKAMTEPQSGAHRRKTIASQPPQAIDLQDKYTCRQCKKSFRSRENLFVHEKNHREARPFPCIRCEKSFYTMQSLKTHLRIHTGEKPFRCTECGFRSNTSSALSLHQKTHRQWRPYSCQQCKQSFWFVHSLIHHLGVHNAKEPHACSDCGRRFARRNGLTLHRKSKHSSEATE